MYGSKKDKGMALGVFPGLLWLDLGIKQYIEENYDEKREETTKIPEWSFENFIIRDSFSVALKKRRNCQ